MGSKERREREKEQRRRQIQKAASSLFLNKGYNATTLEEIADEVELTPGAIYRHFKNKEELFASLLMIPLEVLYKDVKKVHGNTKYDVEEKLWVLKEAIKKNFKKEPLTVRNTFHIQIEDTLSSVNRDIFHGLMELSNKTMRTMAEIFTEGVSRGKFVPRKGIVYADIFWGTLTGIYMWEEAKKKINPSKDFLNETIDHVFDVFISGIKKEE